MKKSGPNAKSDAVGSKLGRLLVKGMKSKQDKNGRMRYFYECVCDCGNEVLVRKDCLMSGNTTSCGCYNKERSLEENGLKFKENEPMGDLIILAQVDKPQNYSIKERGSFWLCQCKCGNKRIIKGTYLRSGLFTNCKKCGASKDKLGEDFIIE